MVAVVCSWLAARLPGEWIQWWTVSPRHWGRDHHSLQAGTPNFEGTRIGWLRRWRSGLAAVGKIAVAAVAVVATKVAAVAAPRSAVAVAAVVVPSFAAFDALAPVVVADIR